MFYAPARWRARLQMMFLVRWTIRQSIVGCYESIGATPFSMLITAFAGTADVARDQSPMASTWHRPPLGWVKTNSDGAVRTSGNMVAVGLMGNRGVCPCPFF
ncbi:hypothetical protein V6N13_118545 [Hibiscus sabdariffa]|uniref:Uncharacterized protein n=2 Tax=Hibiscus sabdariffa TaxID=183260 RepID=A0ABR2BSU6_9ROSI